MTLKTKEIVKYSVIIAIIIIGLWGCKKNPETENTDISPPIPGKISPPMPIDNAASDKISERNKISKIDKITSTAQGWNAALNGYYGKPAPDMKLKDIDGKQHSITALKGVNTVIVRWMTRNEPAKEMVETLYRVQTELGSQNLAVIAISSEDPAILRPVVESMGLTFPIIGRPNRLIDPYRTIRETPVCFFIDKEGKIQLITEKNIPEEIVKSILKAL